MSNINESLKHLYSRNWDIYNHKVYEWENENPTKGITKPLCLAISDENRYYSSDIKVMIFGQETNGWFDDDDRYIGLEGMQDAYMSFYKGANFDPKKKHKGQFKNGFNHIVSSLYDNYQERNIEFVWNNIIKRGKKNGKGRPPEKVYLLERDYFDVVKEEIDILKPDVIIFFTGPYYDKYIANVFEHVNKNESFKEVPGFKKRQLAKIKGINTKIAIRTYHPNYLYRVRGKKKHTDYFNTIMTLIKNAL